MNALSMSKLDGPALPPPPGITSNFINPAQDRATQYNAISFSTLGLASLFLCARLYTRIVLQKSPGWDDLSCVLALLCQAAFTGLITQATRYGVGKHMWDVRAREIPIITHISIVITIIGQPCIFFTKLTLLLFYHRIFYPDIKIKIAIWLGIVVCFVAYLAIMILYICISDLTSKLLLSRAVGIINNLSDFYILAIPMVAISKLQMNRSRKLGVSAVFLTGALACGMGILGSVYRWAYGYSETADLTWELVPVWTVKYAEPALQSQAFNRADRTSTVERDVGIMCACVPLFPYLLNHTSTGKRGAALIRRLHSYLWMSHGASDNGSAVRAASCDGLKPRGAQDEYHELHEIEMAGDLAIQEKTHSYV